MTDINHHRKNRKPVNQRHKKHEYNNGYAYDGNKRGAEKKAEIIQEYKDQGIDVVVTGYTETGAQRIGRTDYLDKSMHSWGRKSTLADKQFGARIGNDFANGHRGMAKSVKGAKKFVRTRIRFHENAAVKKLATTEEDF
jgi:hypothetical protein